jgi:hypothetical protein
MDPTQILILFLGSFTGYLIRDVARDLARAVHGWMKHKLLSRWQRRRLST